MMSRAIYKFGFGRGAVVPGLLLLAAVLAAKIAVAQAPAETKTFQNSQFRFAITLPAGCRHDEGPGTIDAVCSADFDPEQSAVASNATALLLAVGAETVAEDAGKTASDLQRRYGVDGFRDELPEAVCGESDRARVKIGNVKEVVEETRVVYTADVVCAEVKFLQIGERRALVRYVITPEGRYRLVARALAEDFDRQREAIDAFFASFRVLPAAK
jgi:hypothetical protein